MGHEFSKRYFWFGFDFFWWHVFPKCKEIYWACHGHVWFLFCAWLACVSGSGVHLRKTGMSCLVKKPTSPMYKSFFSVIYDENIPSLILAFGYFSQWFLASGLGMCVQVCVFSPWDLLCSNGLPCVFVALCFFLLIEHSLSHCLSSLWGERKTSLYCQLNGFQWEINLQSADHLQNWAFLLWNPLSVLSHCRSYKRSFWIAFACWCLFLWIHCMPIIFLLISGIWKWISYVFPHGPLNDESLLSVNNFVFIV